MSRFEVYSLLFWIAMCCSVFSCDNGGNDGNTSSRGIDYFEAYNEQVYVVCRCDWQSEGYGSESECIADVEQELTQSDLCWREVYPSYRTELEATYSCLARVERQYVDCLENAGCTGDVTGCGETYVRAGGECPSADSSPDDALWEDFDGCGN